MSYQTYTTDAIVVSVRDRMGSDRMVRLFTAQAGMVDARATGVRDEKSKLRYALQPFSCARITLVRGKREWRLTGALSETNIFFSAHDRVTRGLVLRALKQIDRLVVGEEAGAELFRTVTEGLHCLAAKGDEVIYRIMMFRVLTILGYVAPSAALAALVEVPTIEQALTEYTESHEAPMEAAIAQALSVSQL